MPDAFDFSALASALETVPNAAVDETGLTGSNIRYFGDYLLEAEIARGGMGIVYRGRQISLNRVVAVKVLREGLFAGGSEVERFKQEATAAAALRHRNIVGIFDIGEHEGRHFFSMEYVAGETLAQILQHGPVTPGRAAQLVATLARAMHYSHTAGVLHRDLKPSNIIIDTAGEPMITDFGLAKLMKTEEMLTLSGQVLGTPAYMAPEQASGLRGADRRTDVYGLGALLYHLLTGRPPFVSESFVAILQQVTTASPVGTRLLDPSIPRDLDTITARAMDRTITRRYETALAMGEDLERWRAGKPVLARPVSAVEHGWRWALRHRALAATLTLAALLLMTIALISVIAARRLDRAARSEATARRGAEALLQSMLRDMKERLEPLNKLQLLEGVSAAAENYFAQVPDDGSPGLARQRAAMLSARGDILYAQAKSTDALEKQRAALKILERLLAAQPTDRNTRLDTAQAYYGMAFLLSLQRREQEAMPLYQIAARLRQELATDFPGDTRLRHQADSAECEYAERVAKAGRIKEAVGILEPVLIRAATPDEVSTDASVLDLRRQFRVKLGDALWYAGRSADSLIEYQKALTAAAAAAAGDPANIRYRTGQAVALERVGDLLQETRDLAGARLAFERRLTISEEISAGDPANLNNRRDTAAALSRLATVALRQKDRPASLDYSRRAREAYTFLSGIDPDNKAHRASLAELWLDEATALGDTDDTAAAAAITAAISLLDKLTAEEPAERQWRHHLTSAHLSFAQLHLIHGRLAEARQSATTSLATIEKLRQDFPEETRYAKDAETIARFLTKLDRK